jgi:hypothetical protein
VATQAAATTKDVNHRERWWWWWRSNGHKGVYRFSSLVKQNKKAKICFVIHIAGEKKLLFYIYFVIVKQKFINGPLITTGSAVATGTG